MKIRHLLLLIFFSGSGLADESRSLDNWQTELELRPLVGDPETEQVDLTQLVPRQSLIMKAYVWYPTTEAWLPKYPGWDMPGASIEKYPTMQANLNREFNGVAQYGHTQDYILTPLDIGTLELSQKKFDVSTDQDGSEILPIEVRSGEGESRPGRIRLNVSLPDGFYSLNNFIPAYALDVKQEFFLYTQQDEARPLDIAEAEKLTLKKGEMLERRVTIKAKGITGSSIPDILSSADNPNVQVERHSENIMGFLGFEGGKKVESAFYSPTTGGRIKLPSVDIKWWHLKDREIEHSRLDGIDIRSEKVVAYEESIGLSQWEKVRDKILSSITYILAVGLVFVLSLRALRRLWKFSYQKLKSGVRKIGQSEAMCFLRLIGSLLAGSRNKAYQRFLCWQPLANKNTLPEPLIGYFFESYRATQKQVHTSRWLAIRSCIHYRRKLNAAEKSTRKYSLPDLP